jgi:hypothetical protein
MPCHVVLYRYHLFGDTQCLHLQDRDGGNGFLRNDSTYVTNYIRDHNLRVQFMRIRNCYIIIHFTTLYSVVWPISVAARSKAWVCGRSLAGIVGSNPAGGMDVCFL